MPTKTIFIRGITMELTIEEQEVANRKEVRKLLILAGVIKEKNNTY